MDTEFVQWFTTLGVGGVLAAFMFGFYRKDVQQFTDRWREQSDALITVVKENTASTTRLIAVIDALQANQARFLQSAHQRRHTDTSDEGRKKRGHVT